MSIHTVLGAIALGVAMLWAPQARAQYHVTNTADTPVGQACVDVKACSLREAITSATAGETMIFVAPGSYVLTHGELVISSAVRMQPTEGSTGSFTIDANGNSRIFRITSGSRLIIQDANLTRGRHVDPGIARGGAILVETGGDLRLFYISITDSAAIGGTGAFGGAIASDGSVQLSAGGSFDRNRAETAAGIAAGGAVSMTDNGSINSTQVITTFTDNVARGPVARGGAISLLDSGSTCYCHFRDNLADALDGEARGGAIDAERSFVNVSFSEVGPGNLARGDDAIGGGIAHRGGSLRMSSTAVRENEALATADDGESRGGGIGYAAGVTSSQIILEESTIGSNVARATGVGGRARGGGLDIGDVPERLNFARLTITANDVSAPSTADATGSAIVATALPPASTIQASIISGNGAKGSACVMPVAPPSTGYNIVQSGCAAGAMMASDLVTDEPVVRAPAENPRGGPALVERPSPDAVMTPAWGSAWTAAVIETSPAHDRIPIGEAACGGISLDQRGQNRRFRRACEPGAFELRHVTDLAVTIDDGAQLAPPQATVTYRVTIRNLGPQAVVATKMMMARETAVPKLSVACAPEPGACVVPPTIADLETTGAVMPKLAVGDFFAIDVTARAPQTSGTYRMSASTHMHLDGEDLLASNDSAFDQNTVMTVADLAVTVSDPSTSVTPGGVIPYTIDVVNNGPATVVGARLTGAVSAGLDISAIACQPSRCTTPPTIPALLSGYTLPTLTPGQRYRLTVSAPVTATSGTVTSSATVVAPFGTADGVAANDASSDTNTFASAGAEPPDEPDVAAGETQEPADSPPDAPREAPIPRATAGGIVEPVPAAPPVSLVLIALAIVSLAALAMHRRA